MDVAVGLPNVIPDVPGTLLVDWSARAEAAGFAALVATERTVYPGFDPLLAMAAAAGATRSIRLFTDVIVAPLRSPVVLAKDAAGLAELSAGRFVLGLAPGVREDDFVAADRAFAGRFDRFERDIEMMRGVWRGQLPDGCGRSPLSRPLKEDVPMLMGGFSDGAIRRTVRWAVGWAAPSLRPEDVFPFAERVRAAWAAAGRPGQPRIVAMTRFGIGADVAEVSRATARDYFAVRGPAAAEEFAEDAARTPQRVRELLRRYADAGIDELVFNPTVPELSQVDRLAEACFG
jgi:alkanesulfonate monooxygenase SsuD/methylene tetrahydromethanopterin reductase-like flavin-dependent oxidoreductase (luciferase family)